MLFCQGRGLRRQRDRFAIIALPAFKRRQADQDCTAEVGFPGLCQFLRAVVELTRFIERAAITLQVTHAPQQITFGALVGNSGDDSQPFLEGDACTFVIVVLVVIHTEVIQGQGQSACIAQSAPQIDHFM